MIQKEIEKLIYKALLNAQKERQLGEFEIPRIRMEQPEERIHGDYSTNIAMMVSKITKRDAIEIGEKVKSQILDIEGGFFEKIEVAKPGFVNFFLSKKIFIKELKRVIKEKDRYGASQAGKGKTVLIDYSGPNIAKPFGIGHLRSTIIGQAIYNIYKFLGWKCIGDNHLGDWGTQFGKLIVAIKKWGSKKNEDFSIEELEKLYIKFHKEAEKKPALEEEARAWFRRLEQGDKEAKKLWEFCVRASLKEFGRIYKLLDVKIDYALGESFYEKMLEDVIKEAKRKGVASESQKALIIKYPKDELPPTIILKSDGATTYLTRELATVKYRLKKWSPDLIVYEVGVDQALHFKQLFKAIELLRWAKKQKFFHVAHGLIRWKHGKFSTRRGETIHLEEVLKEAIERAKKIIEGSETNRGLSEKEKEEVAKVVGIGAIKYNDLSQHYSRDIIFDWQKILNLKGNSGPYLQYTFARCQNVLKKAKTKINPKAIKVITFNLEEENILRTICRFPEVIQEASQKLSPNLICNFIFDLAQKYNVFYGLHQIIKAQPRERKIFRLALTVCVAQILKNALWIMGISAPEKM